MKQINKDLENFIKDKKAVFLFTGSKESTLLMNILKNMDIDIIFIDTGYHFDEILEYVREFGSRIKTIRNSSASITPETGMGKCCFQRKSEALKEYLDSVKAQNLIVPFRDEERGNGIEDSYSDNFGDVRIIKPLSDLTESDVWIKIKENKLAFSGIYNKGYKIIDCKPCTTRHGRKKQDEPEKTGGFDKETEEKLKALGYM